MPSGFKASTRALVIAAGAPIAPASPQPFTPSGLCVHGVTLVDKVKYEKSGTEIHMHLQSKVCGGYDLQ